MMQKHDKGAVLAEMLETMEMESRRRDSSEPFWFIREVLGYKLEDFHRAWWLFQDAGPLTLILAPRGHGKSIILTVCYSLWRLVQDRDTRILVVSNTQAQAQAFLREVRRHIESNRLLARIYGNLRGSPWTENEIHVAGRKTVAKEASLTALGMYGPVISRHYDMIILDDVIDEENASSPRQRQKALTWYYKELLPCLEPHGDIHIIGTRYHYLDLYGSLLEKDCAGCSMVSRAIRDEDGTRKALWEEKFPLELLLRKREEAGSAIFNSQYQNDVEAMKGVIFRREWFRFYSEIPPGLSRFQAVDLAISKKESADYFAHVTIGMDEKRRIYVLDTFRERLSFESQFRNIQRLYHKHHRPASPVIRVGVEANAYQEALAQKLRSDTDLPVRSEVRFKDKITRAFKIQAHFENGKIFFPQNGAEDLMEELMLFPEGPHDDLFDAFELAVSVAVNTFSYRGIPGPFPDVSP